MYGAMKYINIMKYELHLTNTTDII
jgi:hypothetical protein